MGGWLSVGGGTHGGAMGWDPHGRQLWGGGAPRESEGAPMGDGVVVGGHPWGGEGGGAPMGDDYGVGGGGSTHGGAMGWDPHG